MVKNSSYSEEFKQSVEAKRDELLQRMKQNVRSDLFERCSAYFRRDTNKIIVEVEAEVMDYLHSLELPWWKTALVMGALIITNTFLPFARDAAKRLEGDMIANHQYNARAEFIKSGKGNPTEKIALSKYEESEINVKLCFGEISILLKSKVKLE